MRKESPFAGLKARNVIAQGKALGQGNRIELRPERAGQDRANIVRAFQALVILWNADLGLRSSDYSDGLVKLSWGWNTFALMHRKKVVVICAGLIALACGAFWFFRPSPGYDLARVEPRLGSLQQPYQSVQTAYYMDGGSIGIEIVDRDGRSEQFAISAHLGDTNPHTKVFVGAMHDRKAGAIEVTDSEHTKRMLIHILATTPRRTPHDDICLMYLRRRPSDFARCLIHKWTGHYEP